jgi:hypothetical protein
MGSSRISRAVRFVVICGSVAVAVAVAVDVAGAFIVDGPASFNPFRTLVRVLTPAPLAKLPLLKNWNPSFFRALRRRAGMSATVMPVVNASFPGFSD